jgi:hypothetical protein
MTAWPPIDAPELLARLASGDAAFRQGMLDMARSIGPREFTEELYEHALGYPWPRPLTSYLLDDGAVLDVGDDLGALTAGRFPLLAFGSNGAPDRLALKFAHLEPEQRRILVVAGDLHDFDVGASALPAVYGAMPATIVPSPGTVIRASVLWATAAQVTALTWTELSYALGRLDGVRFDPDVAGAPAVGSVLAYVSRWGAHRVGGEVVVMAQVPARERRAPALTQEQLLGGVAREVLGAGAGARELVVWLIEDFAAAAGRLAPLLIERALPFDHAGWTRYPAQDA